jgi:hypothetical protein
VEEEMDHQAWLPKFLRKIVVSKIGVATLQSRPCCPANLSLVTLQGSVYSAFLPHAQKAGIRLEKENR